jgi:hypothetical protein
MTRLRYLYELTEEEKLEYLEGGAWPGHGPRCQLCGCLIDNHSTKGPCLVCGCPGRVA